MADAFGKPPSGILDGTLTDFGSFEECLEIQRGPSDDGNFGPFSGKFCIADIRAAFDKNIDMDAPRPPNIEEDSIVWNEVR